VLLFWFVIAFFVSRSLARRVTRIRIFAEALLDLTPRALLGASNDELGP